MRTNWLLSALLLLLLGATASQLRAQQSEAERKVFEYIKARADKGDVIAQAGLGEVYYFGDLGMSRNLVEAVKWFRKAADQGLAGAQFDFGFCYDHGEGVTKDASEAVKWYRKAADGGDAKAQSIIGSCYDSGDGLARDMAEAVKWYRKAADQGDPDAQHNLGCCYRDGQGVAQDAVEAMKWFRRAAEQGLGPAQCVLGANYFSGKGVLKDYVEAHKWLNLASAQGYKIGNGAMQFTHGRTPDWANSACFCGATGVSCIGPIGNLGLSAIEPQMTREQIAEAQRLAREFKPAKLSAFGAAASPERIAGPKASGTGFSITEDGFLITNEHVVKDSTQLRLVTSAGFIFAKVVKVDSANDLALLKAEGRFAPLPIAVSRAVKMGGTVATVGFPNIGLQGFAPKLAKGEIASLSGAQDNARYFQISVPVQPGNSGGALVDERGNVVGVVSAKLSARAALATSGSLPENVNYAVKSSFLLGFPESVPEVSAKLKEPKSSQSPAPKFEDVVKSAEQAAVLVLVY